MENNASTLLEIEDRFEAIKSRYGGEIPTTIEIDKKLEPAQQIEAVALDNITLAFFQPDNDVAVKNFILAQYKLTKDHLALIRQKK